LNITLNLDKLEPNRLYILNGNQIRPTNIKTTKIADFLIKNDQLIYCKTDGGLTGSIPPPSLVKREVIRLT
jgi:hypothetical protein